MATDGTPFEGRDNLIGPAVYVSGSLELRAYVNTAGSLTDSTVFADMTEPAGTGYAPITLSGTYSFTNGVVTYDDGTPDNPLWTAGNNWTGGDVTGSFLTDGVYVLHFKDLALGATTMTTGTILEIDLSTLVS